MGNSISSNVGNTKFNRTNASRRHATTTRTTLRNRQQQHQLCQNDRKAKTLPSRHQHRTNADRISSHPNSSTPEPALAQPPPPPNGETSRMLFLLYLIHRTWNVVVDSMDNRSKRSRHSAAASVDSGAPATNSYFEDDNSLCDNATFSSLNITNLDFDDDTGEVKSSSLCGSQYTLCSCSCCNDATQNVYNSVGEEYSIDSIYGKSISICDSKHYRFYNGYQMAPSICRNSPTLTAPNKANSSASTAQKSQCGSSSLNGSLTSYKMTNSENSWPQSVFSKENQRPPVYNPEDYAQTLKKFGKRQNGTNVRSIYDRSDVPTNGTTTDQTNRSSTLPSKHTEYKSPIPAPPESESEMSLRQFASITDLLTKLRADLRVSFPSFVQEFIGTPMDGISSLLEVLRAIQLSQSCTSPTIPASQMTTTTMPRNTQSYQRRALLDELACLQCLSICCSRSLEATARLGTTPVGLMPLASSATGQGIRARILALQLMTAACDKQLMGHGSQKTIMAGHIAVSEAMSTLRLRCSEPVRFRLLVGMLNSGGGSGELQAVGLKFINTFLESAEGLQQRLYLQAEFFQAGLEPNNLVKTISTTSPWLDTLRNEIRRFNEHHIDVERMLTQARDADRVRNQMVILERRVQILHEEKTVLTSMERRLQERCAELQREIFRLQGAHNENNFKTLDKQQPAALPRHVPPDSKVDSSEHEDEGISSSETGPSLSPVPILVLPQKGNLANTQKYVSNRNADGSQEKVNATNTTIEDAMEELDNVVKAAEREISTQKRTDAIRGEITGNDAKEQKIVPVNIVPQPPRKSRSLAHLLSQGGGSELDGSEYGMLLMQNQADQAVDRVTALQTFFDEPNYNAVENDKSYVMDVVDDVPEVNANSSKYQPSTTRQLLDVIMNARHNDDDPTIKAFRDGATTATIAIPPTGGNQHHHHHAAQQQQQQQSHCKRNSYPSAEVAKKVNPVPAQQFNGVFFMTGMNTPQKYPKPDVSAALQARRVTKNVERLEAAFASHELLNGASISDAAVASRSTQQIYFGSNPTLRLNPGLSSFTHNVTVVNNATTRTRSYTQGSKVTDIPSGLY